MMMIHTRLVYREYSLINGRREGKLTQSIIQNLLFYSYLQLDRRKDAQMVMQWEQRQIPWSHTLSDNCIINFKRSLYYFQICLGLKINISKSSFMGIGVSENLIKRYGTMLGYAKSFLPISYLGLPLQYRRALTIGW